MADTVLSGLVGSSLFTVANHGYAKNGGAVPAKTLACSNGVVSLIYSSGQFNNTIIGSGDEIYIVSEAEGYGNTVDPYGLLCVASGGVIFDTDVRSRGTIQIGNGGYAYNITLNSGANLEVSSNAGTIDMLNILSEASASISGNVELQRVSVYSGATLSAIPLVRYDSRLGFECAMGYAGDEWHLNWKLGLLTQLAIKDLPDYRRILNMRREKTALQ